MTTDTASHTVGTRDEWRAARLQLLEAEKELTRRSDELARQRQDLPWVPVDEDYVFDTEHRPASLADLFRGRSQLLVQQLAAGAENNFRPIAIDVGQLPHHGDSDDFVDGAESPGVSAFVLRDGQAFHTYSAYSRGVDAPWAMYPWLDRAPLGRNEHGMWFRRHDEYDLADGAGQPIELNDRDQRGEA